MFSLARKTKGEDRDTVQVVIQAEAQVHKVERALAEEAVGFMSLMHGVPLNMGELHRIV